VHATTPTREAGQTSGCPEGMPGVIEADHLDELIVFASFLDAPPPELRAMPSPERAPTPPEARGAARRTRSPPPRP
jgi:hypothetical protein